MNKLKKSQYVKNFHKRLVELRAFVFPLVKNSSNLDEKSF